MWWVWLLRVCLISFGADGLSQFANRSLKLRFARKNDSSICYLILNGCLIIFVKLAIGLILQVLRLVPAVKCILANTSIHFQSA